MIERRYIIAMRESGARFLANEHSAPWDRGLDFGMKDIHRDDDGRIDDEPEDAQEDQRCNRQSR